MKVISHRLWDVRTGTIVRTLETKASVTSAEVSQDGRYITTADGTSIKFWDANQYAFFSFLFFRTLV